MTVLKKAFRSFAMAIVVFSSVAQAQQVATSNVALRAHDIRAGFVASEKFAESLSMRKPETDMGVFLSDVNNYSITIKPDHDGYLVEFEPLPYEGSMLNGGGALYRVDGKTYKVTDEQHYK